MRYLVMTLAVIAAPAAAAWGQFVNVVPKVSLSATIRDYRTDGYDFPTQSASVSTIGGSNAMEYKGVVQANGQFYQPIAPGTPFTVKASAADTSVAMPSLISLACALESTADPITYRYAPSGTVLYTVDFEVDGPVLVGWDVSYSGKRSPSSAGADGSYSLKRGSQVIASGSASTSPVYGTSNQNFDDKNGVLRSTGQAILVPATTYTFTFSGYDWSDTYGFNTSFNLQAYLFPVPEPGPTGMFLISVAYGLIRRRR